MAELAAPLVCTARGLPYVDVSYGPLIPAELLRAAGRGAAPHWRARGLQPHPFAGLLRHLYVDICPPSLQNAELASVPAVQPLRPVVAAPRRTAAGRALRAAGPAADLPHARDGLQPRPECLRDRAGGSAGRTGVGGRDGRTEQRSGGVGSAAGQRRGAPLHPAGRPAAALLRGGHPRGRRHDAGRPGGGRCRCCACRREPTSTATPTAWSRPAPDSSSSATSSRPQAVRAAIAALLDEPGYRLAARRIAGEIAAMPTPVEALAAITRLVA